MHSSEIASPAPTGLNIDFLRSGKAFVAPAPDEQLSRARAQSYTEKLEQYHAQTLSAVEDAVDRENISRDFRRAKQTPITIVNLDFLRSGAEFSEGRLEEPAEHAQHTIQSENAKLNEYYETTLSAVAKATHGAPVSQARAHPAASIVNVGFITSGRQFSPAPSRRSQSMPDNGSPLPVTRLDAFHARTAEATAAAAQAGLLPKGR